MKKNSLFTRILLPSVLTLLLFPILSCMVFQYAAKQSAHAQAAQDLNTLQKNIIPLMENSFSEKKDRPALNQSFLLKISKQVHKAGGNAQVLIYSDRQTLVYPRDAEEQENITDISDAFLTYLKENRNLANNATMTEIPVNNDLSVLAVFYLVPESSRQLQYLVTYCPANQITNWIAVASRLVLIIAVLFAGLTILILWFTARSIVSPLQTLCEESRRIGSGDFHTIPDEFSLYELDSLRTSMNQMSSHLQESEEMQKYFFQNISHDLRTPLMSIGGYAQGIQQGVFPNAKEAAGTIMEESMRLTELVNSILSLTRLEISSSSPEFTSISAVQSAETAMERMRGVAMEKQVVLKLHSDSSQLMVYGQTELLDQILDNLLSNAIRYAATSVVIRIHQKGQQVQISVLDDGPGIDPKDLPHVFERCYKGKNGKFGIGLAIVRAAATKMNGTVTAANRKSSGAVFTLYLPYVCAST